MKKLAALAAAVAFAAVAAPPAWGHLPPAGRTLHTAIVRSAPLPAGRQLELARDTIRHGDRALAFLRVHPHAGTRASRARVYRNHLWLRQLGRRQEQEALARLEAARGARVAAMSPVELGRSMAAAHPYYWVGGEWSSLYILWDHESGWDPNATNPSGACGIPQDISGCHGRSAAEQIAWGLGYIRGRYGRPSAALGHWSSAGWY